MTDQEKRLRRVSFISGMNGWSIVATTIIFGIISLFLTDWFGASLCLAASLSGVMELRGRRKLKGNLHKAKQWLTLSQVWLFGIIAFYAVYQLSSLYLSPGSPPLPPELQRAMSQFMPLDAETFGTLLKQVYQLVYITIIGVSFLYQGGLFLFYKMSVSKLLSASPN